MILNSSPVVSPHDSSHSRFWLFAFFFCYFAGIGLLNTFLSIHWQSLGYNFSQIGLLGTIAALSGGVALMPLSILSDRLQNRHLFIISSSIASAVCAILFEFVRDFQALMAIQVVNGIGISITLSLTAVLCADVSRAEHAGRGYGNARSGGTLGYLLMMVVMMFVSLKVRHFLSFNLSSFAYLGSALSICMVKRPVRVEKSVSVKLGEVGALLKDQNVLAFLSSCFLLQMAFMGMLSYFTLYLNGLSPLPGKWFIPLALIVSSVAELPFMALGGRFADRYGALTPLKIAAVTMPLRMLGYALFPHIPAILGLQLLHGATFSLFTIAPFAFFTTIAPKRFRATSMALLGIVTMLANTLTPILAGKIADRVGTRALFFYFAGVAILGALILFGFVRAPKTSEENAL